MIHRRAARSLSTVLLFAALALAPRALLAQPGPSGYSPERDAETTLRTPFAWTDGPQFTLYAFKVMRADTGLIVHSTTLPASGAACSNGSYCVLTSEMAGYPRLETRDYKWAVLGYNRRTGTWQWWSPATFSPFHPLPDAPESLSAAWTGSQVTLYWPSSAGAAVYRSELVHDYYGPFAQDHRCAEAACNDTVDVAPISYGTIRVRMRSCGLNGRCTTAGPEATVAAACPSAMIAPYIFTPAAGTSGAIVPLSFSQNGYAERFVLRVDRDGETIYRQEATPRQLSCRGGQCTRLLPLPPGSYTAAVAAACGEDTGPEATVSFTVESGGPTPQLLTPKEGQATSVVPLFAWKKLAGISRYELVFTDTATGTLTTRLVECAAASICAFDTLAEGAWAEGTYTWTVRVGMEGMEYAPAETFTASQGYEPPAPVITSPEDHKSVGGATTVAVHVDADPQTVSVTARLESDGWSADSGAISRNSGACELKGTTRLLLNCLYNPPDLTVNGPYRVHAGALGYAGPVGSGSTTWTSSVFDRIAPSGAAPRASYTIYAQNTQFLPEGPFGLSAGGSAAYDGKTDTERADALADYIYKNSFDVVALSEVFTMKAKDQLSKRLGGYHQIGRIDTAGRVDNMVALAIEAGYVTGFWLGGAPIPLAALAGVTVEDVIREGNSGLAIYSKFPFAYVPNKGYDSHNRCTDDTFNELDDVHPAFEPTNFNVNDYLWFRQYCEGVGTDELAAKGIAAAELRNDRTGVPLLVAWSHTQAPTAPSAFGGFDLEDYKASYQARADQIEHNTVPAVNKLLGRYGTSPFDAFILGDWNLPAPASVGEVPRRLDDSDAPPQTSGGTTPAILAGRLYTPGGAGDPTLATLARPEGEYGYDGETLFGQYWEFMDPRHDKRAFGDFHDLWLENPDGATGWTMDPTNNGAAHCLEAGEPCHATGPLDRGLRYDTVLARFHSSNIPSTPAERQPPASYGGMGLPAWGHASSCVQHVRLARDYDLSDHWGTIIEVGPSAPYCGPSVAKADPHRWRYPAGSPKPDPPKDQTYDAALGLHPGEFTYGGANEWFYLSEEGGFDILLESKDPTIPGIRVDAYDAGDLSVLLPVADAEQRTDQTLLQACNGARSEIAERGLIPEICATRDHRITYRSPRPFFVRIRPAYAGGEVCYKCTGRYKVYFRKRTCKAYYDALTVAPGIETNGLVAPDRAWMGEGQRDCWISFELRQPSDPSIPQTLTWADQHLANDFLCAAQASQGIGSCSSYYAARFYDNPGAEVEPTEEIAPPRMFQAGGGQQTMPTGPSWFAKTPVKPETGRKKFFVRMTRENISRPHFATFPWSTDLRSATFQTVSVLDIQDDLEIEVEVCLPFIGCVGPFKDPFQDEDEVLVRTYANEIEQSSHSVDMGLTNAGFKTWFFPNQAPQPGGLPPGCAAYGRCFQPGAPTAARGFTVNYTDTARASALEEDPIGDDVVIGDGVMCGVSGAPPYADWQTSYLRSGWEDVLGGGKEQRDPWAFSDDCPDPDPQFRYEMRVYVPRVP